MIKATGSSAIPANMPDRKIEGKRGLDDANRDSMASEGSSNITLGFSDKKGNSGMAKGKEGGNMAKKTVYACEGSCHGVASEAQWKAGAKTCAAKGCELHGKPLKKKTVDG